MEDNQEIIKIPLTQGKFTIIDADKYHLVSSRKWFAVKHGLNWYAGTKIKGKMIKMHRVLMDVTDRYVLVDHINHDGLDNRLSNLRLCNNHQNILNTSVRKNSSSKYLGVSYKPVRKRKLKNGNYSITEQSKKWLAQIQFNKKKKIIGKFKTEEEAALAYNEHAKILFKEYANLNVLC